MSQLPEIWKSYTKQTWRLSHGQEQKGLKYFARGMHPCWMSHDDWKKNENFLNLLNIALTRSLKEDFSR